MRAKAPLAGHTVIYGGSFDPPHMGHQMACLLLLEGLGCSEVWIMPAYAHPFGKTLTDFAHRFAMCRLIAAPFDARVYVSDAEQRLGGLGRTYDLVASLKAADPKRRFALAIGADLVEETPRWHRWPELEAMVRVVVIGRSGYAAHTQTPDLPPLSSRAVRAQLACGKDPQGELPQSVLAYIEEHKLYVGPGPL